MSQYLEFYRDERKTAKDDFSFEDILGFSDKQLENEHMYIQWVFPNPVLSKMQPSAATEPLTEEAAREMRQDQAVAARAKQMVTKMLNFWGMDDDATITNKQRFVAKLRRVNHNQQRMTRMLIFLKCMGWTDLLDGIRAVLVNNVPPRTKAVKFWTEV